MSKVIEDYKGGIIHCLPDAPKEGSIVYVDNGQYAPDRAVYRDGAFYGGGDFPVREYKMSQVKKWFYLDEYSRHKNSCAYTISFKEAAEMNGVNGY